MNHLAKFDKIMEAYPDKFKEGNVFGLKKHIDEISYISPQYDYGRRLCTVSHNELGYLVVLTVGDHPSDISRHATQEEVIKNLKWRI